MDAAHRMRALMGKDQDEYKTADEVRAMNDALNVDKSIFEGAWKILGSEERTAWNKFRKLVRS